MDSKRLSLGALGVGALGLAVLAGCFGVCVGWPCLPTGVRYGMWLDECPDGDLRLGGRLAVKGVVRGDWGEVEVLPHARLLRGEGREAWVTQEALYRGVDVDLALLDAGGEPVDLEIEDRDTRAGWRTAKVRLPDLPDGDYTFRATLTAPFETVEIDAPLPLYTPALAHVMTDRPLYRPGQDVRIRSVTLERTDLAPLDGRPGRWRIVDPTGAEMLVEKDAAGAFGVADTSFPLDDRAAVGTWAVEWVTGEVTDRATFEVRPFRLPRFTVEVAPDARWYGIGDAVRLEGFARYASGAPVADAPVVVQLRVAEGRWPMPLAWEAPIETRTGRDGRFAVEVGEVPGDLIERGALSATVRVTEAAGETATGAARVVLSEDDLRVEAVTELGDGLVEGFNNRAYLRVSTPDGTPLPGATVTVGDPWDPTAPTREATADEDGVVALQLDPGAPVTVVRPAPPVRVRPYLPDPPSLVSASHVLDGRALDLAERRALDAATARIADCGDFVRSAVDGGAVEVRVGVRASGGRIVDVLTGEDPVEQCVGAAVRGLAFPTRGTFALSWSVPDSLVPALTVAASAAYGWAGGVQGALDTAGLEARRCLARGRGVDGRVVYEAHWRVTEGSRAIEASVSPPPAGTGLGGSLACVRQVLSRARLDDEATASALGAARVTLEVPEPPGPPTPQPTTSLGYELAVTAARDGATIGETRLQLPVGRIPPLRLRATPALASPGDEVVVELLRGPDFTGELPEEVVLREGSFIRSRERVEDGTVTFTLPEDSDGFFHVDVGDARAVIYARPAAPLSVTLSTEQAAYRPGETAKLLVSTRAGDRPTSAAVGLSGVDLTLAQLAPLPGPDAIGRVTVRAEGTPAFGAFDPRALALGQVRGENAAKATLLRVTRLPTDVAGDVRSSTSSTSTHDDEEVLITHFYTALEALHARVRAWEAEAPEGEVMEPATMVALWNETLRDLPEPATDAFGRPLTLDVLPDDLLAQVDPRQVVADGTRLPEDVIAWDRYVREEVTR